MEYKKYEYPSFNIYTVKTNKFKTRIQNLEEELSSNKKVLFI